MGGGKLFISVTKTRRSHGQRGRETGDPWGQLRGTPTATRAGGGCEARPPILQLQRHGGARLGPGSARGQPGAALG